MLIYERGKQALGEGNNSVGDLLPEMFRRAGLTGLETFLNDQTFALSPPYSSADQQALRRASIDNANANQWFSPESEARRCSVAGGGQPATPRPAPPAYPTPLPLPAPRRAQVGSRPPRSPAERSSLRSGELARAVG